MDANIKHAQNMCKLLLLARTSVLGFMFYLWLRMMSLSTNTLNTITSGTWLGTKST